MAFFLVESLAKSLAKSLAESLAESLADAARAACWEHEPEHDILLVYLNL